MQDWTKNKNHSLLKWTRSHKYFDDMPQSRPGDSKNHYTSKKSANQRFLSLVPCSQNLVWLFLIGFKTKNRNGLNSEIKKGSADDRANNPGSVRQSLQYEKVFGELPKLLNTRHKFRSRAQVAYNVAKKFSEEKGMIFISFYCIAI